MHVLGNLTGKGILMVDGAAKGEVSYDISVFQSASSKSASGSIEGDMGVLFEGFTAGKSQLRLRDGQVIDIILSEVTGEDATIKVSGPLPGF
ncbi:hypothetical protein IVB08_06485 [Bradyrhizobium sp. 173]|uniref:hypothetical protein n=1 Tax=unclassified Bradyrhizobium TaxID=2631580 RepID=UPI001FFA5E29|nr:MULTISPECIES: hypothetical protein [unclassified Bradyrhizobium]MCK1322932.1 hypothetical protein [Bradyrhizobium sp. 156]MCK1563625.1 hypothetical protein [Bradyrhizobium sp. 173]